MWRIHRSRMNSLHKGQWRGALVLISLICAWTNGWANHRDAGEFRRHLAHYDASVIEWPRTQGKAPFEQHKANSLLFCSRSRWNSQWCHMCFTASISAIRRFIHRFVQVYIKEHIKSSFRRWPMDSRRKGLVTRKMFHFKKSKKQISGPFYKQSLT